MKRISQRGGGGHGGGGRKDGIGTRSSLAEEKNTQDLSRAGERERTPSVARAGAARWALGAGPKDEIHYLCASQLKTTFSRRERQKKSMLLYVLYPYVEHMYGPRPLPAGTTY